MKQTSTRSSRTDLIKRLDSYWRLELVSVLGVPTAVCGLVIVFGGSVGLASLLGIAPNVLLLAIGGFYWRAKLHQIEGDRTDLDRLLPVAARLRGPILVLTAAASVAAVVGWVLPDWTAGLADRWVGTGFAVFAVLEYVNYYHRQLQHFDHQPDQERFFGGDGFRRSALARDLARLRG